MEMCRACLTTGTGMVPMDQNFINKYNILTNLNVQMADNMPLHTCNTCNDGAQFCIEFREKCIVSEQTLTGMLFSKIKDKIIQEGDEKLLSIKKEVKLELEYENTESIDESYHHGEEYVKVTTQNRPPRGCRGRTKELSNDSKLHCGICPKKMKNIDDLTNHLEHHKMAVTSDTTCGLCPEQFISLPHLLGHRMAHVPAAQKVCHICARKFMSAENLEFHYMRVHEMAEKDAPIPCKKCPKSYPTVKQLQKHMIPAHECQFSCGNCSKRFRTMNGLRVHESVHEGKHTYECELCDYVSKHPAAVKEHKLRKHTVGRVNCKTCRRMYASQELLDRHQCKHSPGVVCPVCGVTVRAASGTAYNRHLLTHQDVYPYKCEECPAKFKSTGTYRAHKDKHAGTPRWRCEHCTRAFYLQSALIKHRRTHTGEKPYVCEICSRGFTGNNNLKVHMKVHGVMDLIKKKNRIEER